MFLILIAPIYLFRTIMNRLKNIFFDFDGVIAESVNAKTEAFRDLYLPYGKEIADKVVKYHIYNGGVSRFEKFRYFHNAYLNELIDENKVNELAKKFSSLVLDKVINSEEVPGANEFIKEYNERLRFWVITGTPTNEIELIAQKRGLKKYFIGLHGSPEKKKYWTEYLISKFDLEREETIFLGDATTDWEAAQHSNINFALRETDENIDLFKSYNGVRFKDFYELIRIIGTELK